MNNTSATGGFLQLSPAPDQADIEDVLHDCIAGITGLPGDLVRPRFQPDPPRVPKPDVSWCAFGIKEYNPHNFPVIAHCGTGEGHDEITDHEDLPVLVSFYGPQHVARARLLRLGLHVPQNRTLLRSNGLAFVKGGTVMPVPELVAMQWRARADLPLFFRLETRRSYAILNLKTVQGSVQTDAKNQTQTKAAVPIGCISCPHACWREK